MRLPSVRMRGEMTMRKTKQKVITVPSLIARIDWLCHLAREDALTRKKSHSEQQQAFLDFLNYKRSIREDLISLATGITATVGGR